MSYYGNYRTRTFANVFPDVNTFKTFYNGCGIPARLIATSAYASYNIDVVYALLLANYANSHVKSADENRFKLQLMAIIYEAGPVWQREMYLQDKIRNLTDDDLLKGSKTIFNHAMHPDAEPSTSSLEELEYIDDQNTSNYKKEQIKAYTDATEALDDKICQRFVQKFKKLFLTVDYPDDPLLYVSNEEEE